MNFLAADGALALASRLKLLSDRCYDAVDQVYRQHGSRLQARWFPLLRLLQQHGPLTVGEAAREIGQTHSAISQLAAKLIREGWLSSGSGEADRRQRVLALTPQAEAELKAARPLWQVLRTCVEGRIAASEVDLLQALSVIEDGLIERPLPTEVARQRRAQDNTDVRIVPFGASLREHFYRLNAEWLGKYYRIEPIDHAVLSEPEHHILEPGGAIFFAVLGDEVIGTCALMRESTGVYELTKMAVTERSQGLGIGRRLMEAAIAEYRRLGGHTLFLESNHRLRAALKLYESVGFELQPGVRPGSHYQRADVYMVFRDPERPSDRAAAGAVGAASAATGMPGRSHNGRG